MYLYTVRRDGVRTIQYKYCPYMSLNRSLGRRGKEVYGISVAES